MAEPSLTRALELAERAIAAGELDRAYAALEPHRAALDQERALAALWLDLLRAAPLQPGLRADAERILARWPDQPELVLRACDALIRAAERVAPDEPIVADGPAQLAARAAAVCLTAVEQSGASSRDQLGYLVMCHANALRLSHAYDEALAAYERALALEPERGAFWFNLGLLHKARRDWQQALHANQRARALLGGERAVLWNLAISATALGEGAIAVETLKQLGFAARLAASGMPFVEGLPPVQVRAATIGAGLAADTTVPERSVGFELVWATPLSPCHGVVSSATYRDASIDYGDLVLWDGVPLGVTELDGRKIPRFALLALLKRGDERRFRFVALQQAEGQVLGLASDLPQGAQLFLHQERVEQLCARCASGEHMHKHVHEAAEPHRLAFGKLVLPASADLNAFRGELDARLRRHPGVQLVMPGLLEAIGDTANAGKAHQLWRGVVRSGMKAVR